MWLHKNMNDIADTDNDFCMDKEIKQPQTNHCCVVIISLNLLHNDILTNQYLIFIECRFADVLSFPTVVEKRVKFMK